MGPTQRLPASLTPLEMALAGLLHDLVAAAPVELPLAEALGCITVDMPALAASPPCDIAIADGWALRARDLVGASSYTPLLLAKPPIWVEAGDADDLGLGGLGLKNERRHVRRGEGQLHRA